MHHALQHYQQALKIYRVEKHNDYHTLMLMV